MSQEPNMTWLSETMRSWVWIIMIRTSPVPQMVDLSSNSAKLDPVDEFPGASWQLRKMRDSITNSNNVTMRLLILTAEIIAESSSWNWSGISILESFTNVEFCDNDSFVNKSDNWASKLATRQYDYSNLWSVHLSYTCKIYLDLSNTDRGRHR